MNIVDKTKVATSFLNYIYDETKIIWNERCELQTIKEKKLKINKKKKLNIGSNGYRYLEKNRNTSTQVPRLRTEG